MTADKPWGPVDATMTTIEHAILVRPVASPATAPDRRLLACPEGGRLAFLRAGGCVPVADARSRRLRAPPSYRLCPEAGMRQRKLNGLLGRHRSDRAARLAARAVSRRLGPVVGGLCLMHGLSGCMLTSDKVELAIPVADHYQLARGSPDAALPKLDWWRGFHSSELTTMMELAQAANFDIAAATARIMQ